METPSQTTGYRLRVEPREGVTIVKLEGRLALEDMRSLMSELLSIPRAGMSQRISVDLSGVEYLDSAGALALIELQNRGSALSIPVDLLNISEKNHGLLSLIDREVIQRPPLRPEVVRSSIVENLGELARRQYRDFQEIMSFVGELITALLYCLAHPRLVRWADVMFYMKRAGADGLPIVALISLLLGLIMAFMSSLQLKQFGANIYVANLVTIAMVRELGPIMTAIIVAGRSGSAFAAEIGTMIVNDEVNALVTMGFDPTRFLAVPKVLAAMIVVPILTVYSDFFAILGGLIVGVTGLDLTVYTYILQTKSSISIFDFVTSLTKAVVFALLISGIGCQRGFQVKGGAEGVGTSTTSAVVSAIFLIILFDSAFAIMLNYLRH
ncbi:MAG TPA: MlaE family lipid ABC transporter permease subunit [Syntrophales bacterium]|nr:MlaE family lipid ABC transporter permease subunit [Syntrophales bacterium]